MPSRSVALCDGRDYVAVDFLTEAEPCPLPVLATLVAAIGMSAQAEYFAHNDLLPLIALQLPRSSIAALRLMNSHINRQIAGYMFRTLRLRFHSWCMNRLYWIAANPTLRKGVRELVFDTASYYPREQEGDVPGEIGSILTAYIQQALEDAGLSMRNTAEGNRQCIALRKRHDEATRDENDAMSAWLGDPPATDEALLALQGCTTLTLTPWESLTGERNALPPPLADLSSRSHTYLAKNAARLMLIGEPHRLRHQFKVLNILGASQDAFGVGNRDSHRRNFPGIALWWNKRCPVLMTLRRQLPSTSPLTQLRLEIELENLDDTALTAFVETTTDASFAGLWSMAPNLRELDLEIRVRPQLPLSDGRYEFAAHSTFLSPATRPFFRSLTTLILRSMWLEQDHLAGFITAHKSTLTHISLFDVTLGSTSGQPTPYLKAPWLYVRPLFSNFLQGREAFNDVHEGALIDGIDRAERISHDFVIGESLV